ncbi:BTAD domain-containing putative transcriptional regulator [Nonomuraea sp. NPDC023979]|uniref:AfsR/SARP family transcriptional regulator n=1 Tax=Nonomuraea sp. NPDC023979 TaxID=3154796 RepID=UPI0033E3D998
MERDTSITFAVLGPLEVRRDGELVDIAGRRLRTLLGLLVLDAGRTVPVERLVAGIWDDREPAAVANALQALVSRLRTALGKNWARQLVVADPSGYRLIADPDQVDARRFTVLAGQGHAALAAGDPRTAAALLREALALWRGPVLAGLPGCAAGPAAHLESRRLSAVEDRIEADLLLGRPAGLLDELAGLLAGHPLRERLHAQRMRALHAAGRRVEALAAYEEARRTFRDELGADPSPALTSLHLTLLRDAHPTPETTHTRGSIPDLPKEPPAPEAPHPESLQTEAARPPGTEPPPPALSPFSSTLRPHPSGEGAHPAEGAAAHSGAPRPGGAARAEGVWAGEGGSARVGGVGAFEYEGGKRGNVRARLTSFVGREQDLAYTAGLVGGHRLVTLIGPGGAGKTRLATEVAGSVGLPDGVWLAELAPVQDEAGVVQSVTSALDVRDALPQAAGLGVTEPLDRLVAALRGKRLLIVLDNCEHVVEQAARVADRVLADCPGVRILATSREPLGITGEVTWTLPPLGLPPAGTGADEAGAYPAVRLFAERAAAVRPGYEVGADTEAVVAICRALDGMPLAIELAAARLRSMSASEIASRLGGVGQFRLLSSGSRTAQPRHQTLRAVVEWSWNLLDEQERALGRRLSVFAGGAGLATIERLYGDVLEPLTRLVDKSLVVFDGGRYRMLETIRAYAHERLAESGELEDVRRRHAHHFTELAEAAEPGLRTGAQLDRLAELTAEHENLTAALRWATATATDSAGAAASGGGAAAVALRLVGALGWYWWLRGHRLEGALRAREVLEATPGAPGPARALGLAVYVLNGLGTMLSWEEAGEAQAEIGRLKGPPPHHPLVAMVGPMFVMFGATQPEAEQLMAEMARHPDPWVVAAGQLCGGLAHYAAGRIEEGERDYLAALDGFRAAGDRWGAGTALAGMSDVLLLRGESTRGIAVMREALRVMDELGAQDDTAYMRARLALGLNQLGHRAEAEEMLREVVRLVTENGDQVGEAGVVGAWGEFARQDGDLATARELFARSAEIMERARGVPLQMVSAVNASRGLLSVQEGDLPEARRLVALGLEQAAQSGDAQLIGIAVIACAAVALAAGRAEDAAALLGGAEAVKGIAAVVDFDHVRITGDTEAALGAAEFGRHLARGRRMDRDAVIALALRV